MPPGFTGLSRAELGEAFAAELARGYRLATVGGAAASLVEEAVTRGRNLAVLAGDDDWPRGVARLVAGALESGAGGPAPEGRRRPGMWLRRRR